MQNGHRLLVAIFLPDCSGWGKSCWLWSLFYVFIQSKFSNFLKFEFFVKFEKFEKSKKYKKSKNSKKCKFSIFYSFCMLVLTCSQ